MTLTKDHYLTLSVDEIEEEIDCLLECDQVQRLTLISTDAIRYISIIEHYTDNVIYQDENMGEDNTVEVSLSTLCNIVIRRPNGFLTIKYRMYNTDRWYEVGFQEEDGKILEEFQVSLK